MSASPPFATSSSVAPPLVIGRFTGPAYPFGAAASDALGPKDDIHVVFTSIVNILTTPKGSIPYYPRLGSLVPYLLFEINDEVTRNLIRYYTYKDLNEQEPRIYVQAVYTQVTSDLGVRVTVAFSLVGDPSAKVYSAPITFPGEV